MSSYGIANNVRQSESMHAYSETSGAGVLRESKHLLRQHFRLRWQLNTLGSHSERPLNCIGWNGEGDQSTEVDRSGK